MSPWRRPITGAAIFAIALISAFFASGLFKDVQFAQAQQKVEASREQLAKAEDLSTVFREVGKAVEPSVVNIQVTKSVRTGGNGNRRLPFDEDLLRRFFPDRDGDGSPDVPEELGDGGEDGRQMGTGSGVVMEVVDGGAFVVTNNHVAGGATEMRITLADGRTIEGAKLVGTDPKTDLAVIRIEADRLIAAKWGNSDDLQKGDWIMAFGSPFGYIGSMTHGIVSALNRTNIGILGSMGYENFIQVDAPINPGNSGGPLVNVRGEVVGINTAIASMTGSSSGIGFAIPSNQAKVVYQSLRDKGKIVRGYLGVAIDDVKNPRNPRTTSALRDLGYEGKEGIFVLEVPSPGPSVGKLMPGDVITHLDGKPVTTVQDLRNTVAATAPDKELKMRVVREGKEQDVSVNVGEQPDEMASLGLGRGGSRRRGAAPGGEDSSVVGSLGLRLSDLNEALAERHGLTDVEGGALVTQVAPNSPAAAVGIRPGDLVTRVAKQSVANAAEAIAALSKQDLTQGVTVHVTNKEGSKLVTLQAPK